MRLRFAIVGGDKRQVCLAELLWQDGHRVSTYALEKAALRAEIPKAGCLQGCVYAADCVILPTPAETGALLRTPLSGESLSTGELIASLWEGQRLFGGALGDGLCLAALRQGQGRRFAAAQLPWTLRLWRAQPGGYPVCVSS